MIININSPLDFDDVAYLTYINSTPANVIPIKIISIMLDRNKVVSYFYELINKNDDHIWFPFRKLGEFLYVTQEEAQIMCDKWNNKES